MTGQATDALREDALRHGAQACLAKPFSVEELEAALATSGGGDGEAYEIVHVPALEEILEAGLLQIAFQPIVELRDGVVTPFAFEALARVPGFWSDGGAGGLFHYAARRGMMKELNLAALERAVESAATLPGDPLLFINLDPCAFGPALMPLLARAAQRARVPLSRVVLEVTENSAFARPEQVAPLFDALREAGVRFALDDHGSAYSHLSIIARLQPSFVKISNTFGTRIEEDAAKQRIVAHVAAMARDFGCRTVLEGIEGPATADEAARLGLDFAQGYHFGRPQFASHWKERAA
jgi:EAL domain-containing protein (putative c-di-GMP-specific phosphodiesterase class I)